MLAGGGFDTWFHKCRRKSCEVAPLKWGGRDVPNCALVPARWIKYALIKTPIIYPQIFSSMLAWIAMIVVWIFLWFPHRVPIAVVPV